MSFRVPSWAVFIPCILWVISRDLSAAPICRHFHFQLLLPIDVLQATQTLLLFLSSPSQWRDPLWIQSQHLVIIPDFPRVKSSIYIKSVHNFSWFPFLHLSIPTEPSVDFHCYCPESSGCQWGQCHPEGIFWKIRMSMTGTFTDHWNHWGKKKKQHCFLCCCSHKHGLLLTSISLQGGELGSGSE